MAGLVNGHANILIYNSPGSSPGPLKLSDLGTFLEPWNRVETSELAGSSYAKIYR